MWTRPFQLEKIIRNSNIKLFQEVEHQVSTIVLNFKYAFQDYFIEAFVKIYKVWQKKISQGQNYVVTGAQ